MSSHYLNQRWNIWSLLLILPSGTNFSEMLVEIQAFSFRKMHLKMLSVKWWSFCLSLNVLMDGVFLVKLFSVKCHWTLLMISQYWLMTSCHQATSHYRSQCWPIFMSPYGIPRPQWVNSVSRLLQNWDIVPRKMLTHWGRDKMANILQTVFSNAFSWLKIVVLWFKFH